MSRLRTALATLTAAFVLAGTLAFPTSARADDLAPVKRVSCPSLAAMNQVARGRLPNLTELIPTTTTCTYLGVFPEAPTSEPTSVVSFWFDTSATPAEAQAGIAASWPEEAIYPFSPQPVPSLGSGAFLWADASDSFLYWQMAPGVVGLLFGHGAVVVDAAPLFRPQMEVYTVPGTRTVNGRQWRTTCENYSATARCTTHIWATVITRTPAGAFQRHDGWAFNSLTYRWSNRSLWATNPLAAYGRPGGTTTWTSTTGRQWRTECDTTTTGRGACRSYIHATVYEATPTGYQRRNTWVFNNQVLFNS